MRLFIPVIAIALAATAAPAFADTLQEATTKGLILSVAGNDIEFKFTPDGRFTALDGALPGKWRIDDDKLCTTGDADGNETCLAFPTGKKSGDKFEVETPMGPIEARIK
jgi:hypothetical protein